MSCVRRARTSAGDGARVRFDRDLVLERIKTAPPTFTLHASNPAHDLRIGGDWMAFGSVAARPTSSDMDGGRRVGNRADFQNLIRLGQMFNVVHFLSGYPVEPIDIHPSIRHLDAIYDMLTLADKPIHAYSLGRQRNLDALEMARIARGIDEATLEREPSIFTVINSSSPLRLDMPMLAGDPDVLGAQPGHRDDAVHAGRRDGAGDARRRARRAERRGAWRASR